MSALLDDGECSNFFPDAGGFDMVHIQPVADIHAVAGNKIPGDLPIVDSRVPCQGLHEIPADRIHPNRAQGREVDEMHPTLAASSAEEALRLPGCGTYIGIRNNRNVLQLSNRNCIVDRSRSHGELERLPGTERLCRDKSVDIPRLRQTQSTGKRVDEQLDLPSGPVIAHDRLLPQTVARCYNEDIAGGER